MYKNTIIEKGFLIKKIIANESIEEIYDLALSNIFKNGPVNRTDLEILSYLKELKPDFFKEKENNLVQIIVVLVFIVLIVISVLVEYKTTRKSRRLEW